MSFDLEYLQVPIFPGINDVPVEVTDSKAGNAADFISKFNQLLSDATANLNELQSSKWLVVFTDAVSYTASSGDKLVVTNSGNDGSLVVYLPNNPNSGDTVSFIKTNDNDVVDIENYGTFKASQYTRRITLAVSYLPVTFIYVDTQFGWISNNESSLVFEYAQN